MTIAKILLKVSPFMSIAILAPINDPTSPEAPQYKLNGNVLIPLDLKPATPVKDCIKIPILLVPFATEGGNPKKMSAGSVNKEPPPAMVFMNPAMKPTNTNKSKLKSKSANSSTKKYMRDKSKNKLIKSKFKFHLSEQNKLKNL